MERCCAAVLAFALTACQNTGAVMVETDYDPDIAFSGYRTYAQAEPPATSPGFPLYTELSARRIQGWIDEALTAQGYEAASWKGADLRVAFQIGGVPRTEIWYWDSGTWTGPRGVSSARLLEGSLVIGIADRERGRLIWRGVGRQQTLDDDFDAAATERAVKRVLQRFPPDAKERKRKKKR